MIAEETEGQPTLAPVLLQGRKIIAKQFRVRPLVVSEWVKAGAPIFIAGQMWQAEFWTLLHWLVKHRPAIGGD